MHSPEATQNQREYTRIRFREPVEFRLRDPQSFGGCLAQDISEGGIRIMLNEFVPLNTEVAFQLKFGEKSQVVELKGHVVWIQQAPYSERYHVGLEFDQTTFFPKSKERIHKYVLSRRF